MSSGQKIRRHRPSVYFFVEENETDNNDDDEDCYGFELVVMDHDDHDQDPDVHVYDIGISSGSVDPNQRCFPSDFAPQNRGIVLPWRILVLMNTEKQD
jgi:hypothetical protein